MKPILPIFEWLPRYRMPDFRGDLIAGVIVTLMLIPQSLAYALLAGLPPQVGLYASIAPLLAYALLGSSRTLAVGPVAVVSLMTADAIAGLGISDPSARMAAALALAALVGGILLVAGLLRLGFLSTLLSHPVVSGFISASAILIALSQLGPILGLSGGGDTVVERVSRLVQGMGDIKVAALLMGSISLVVLIWVRKELGRLLLKSGIAIPVADVMVRAAPAIVVAVTTGIAAFWQLDVTVGLAVVGDIPAGLPPITIPVFDVGLWRDLLMAAVLISLVGFVESISVAQSFATKRREKVDANQELMGLGAANLSAAFTGGYPVTGGFARTAVSFAAGARTPMAGVLTAIFIGLVALALTPWFHYLPKAVLSATIVAAVVSLVDITSIRRTWAYARADSVAELTTIVVVLFVGIEAGVAAGVAMSFLLYIAQTGRPHIAVVGRVAGTEHYRNVLRHKVETDPRIVAFRVDENLYFINARHLEASILQLIAGRPQVRDMVMICSGINVIDGSALEMLRALNEQLEAAGIRLHLAELKGPVIDKLQMTDFLKTLSGNVYLSTHEAMADLIKRDTVPEDDSI